MNFFKFKNNQERDNSYDEDYYGKNEVDENEGFDSDEPEEKAAPVKEPERPAVRRAPAASDSGASYSMKLMKPVSYDDGPMIANELLANNAVIINLESANAETAANLIYFLDGVTYAINGHLKPVSANTFMLTPRNMEISEAGNDAPSQAEEAAAAQNYQGFGGYGYRN